MELVRTCKLDSWDHQIYHYMWAKGGYALVPPLPLTGNVGFDGDATTMSERPEKLEGLDASRANERRALAERAVPDRGDLVALPAYDRDCERNI